jgi:hypothetical protein
MFLIHLNTFKKQHEDVLWTQFTYVFEKRLHKYLE